MALSAYFLYTLEKLWLSSKYPSLEINFVLSWVASCFFSLLPTHSLSFCLISKVLESRIDCLTVPNLKKNKAKHNFQICFPPTSIFHLETLWKYHLHLECAWKESDNEMAKSSLLCCEMQISLTLWYRLMWSNDLSLYKEVNENLSGLYSGSYSLYLHRYPNNGTRIIPLKSCGPNNFATLFSWLDFISCVIKRRGSFSSVQKHDSYCMMTLWKKVNWLAWWLYLIWWMVPASTCANKMFKILDFIQ